MTKPRKPVTDEQFAIALEKYNAWQANIKGRNARMLKRRPYKGCFAHLPRVIACRAEINLRRYLLKPQTQEKLRTLTGHRRNAYFGSLCACAIAHAKHKGLLGRTDNKLCHNRGHRARLKIKLGLQEPRRVNGEQKVATVHYGHGEPVAAESSQTNMDGV